MVAIVFDASAYSPPLDAVNADMRLVVADCVVVAFDRIVLTP